MPLHHDASESHATCPQKLVDLILGGTDKETLKSRALAARSFRLTSQKLIFSELTILPPGCGSIPALQRLADVFSAFPHIALHVRTLRLVQAGFYASCVWMQSDILPVILPLFTNLASLKIRIYNWHIFHSNCEQALHSLITQSMLSSIELEGARLQTNVKLLELLQCHPTSLESASFRDVYTHRSDLNDASLEFAPTHLTVLHIDSHTSALYHWAMRAVDPKCLRDLHTEVQKGTRKFIQRLLDSAVYVETYHLSFWGFVSQPESPNLARMESLGTLELSVELDWDEIEEVGGQDQHNPLNDAMRSLATAPHTVEHLILNLKIRDSYHLKQFVDSPVLDRPLERLEEGLPELRDVVVRIVSGQDHSILQRAIQYLKDVFHGLETKGMLTAVIVRPVSSK
ncbi:hypothetical protein B0H16DRAFT_158069 [Mycena metata]|uniref:Uncharacterized protein n=1 Tax=Mycena metata TaxID=1033252 RepID=A0AAD7I4S8_9AGAR|nr:hypothetical protein B0H16DRAFT_158069 [Mycena metata]